MRILMLTDCYPPWVGGTEQYVRALSEQLVARGHAVSVATFRRRDLPAERIENGVRVHRIAGTLGRIGALYVDPQRTYAAPMPDPEVLGALVRIVKRERPQIVHAHNWLIHSFAPLKVWSRARLALTLHDYSFVCAKKTMLRHGQACGGPGLRCVACSATHYGPFKGIATLLAHQLLNRLTAARVDMFLPVSHAVARASRLAEAGLPFEVIPPFVADDGSQPPWEDAALLAQLPDEPFLLFVGALVPYKGGDVLLGAYTDLRARLGDVPPLVLIGGHHTDPPPRTPPPGVRVLHAWPHRAVMHAWRRALLGVIPSRGPEGFPLVALEAMAAGVPVVASSTPGLNEAVVHGQTGLLVPPGDRRALVEALASLLRSPEVRQRLGHQALAHARAFSAAGTLARLERVYQGLSTC